MGWWRPLGLAIAGSALALFTLTASADDLEDEAVYMQEFQNCIHEEGQRQIDACSVLIEAGDKAKFVLDSNGRITTPYKMRGHAYKEMGDYDRAIEDFDRTIASIRKNRTSTMFAAIFI